MTKFSRLLDPFKSRRNPLRRAAQDAGRCLLEQLEARQLLSAQLVISDTSGANDDKAMAFAATAVGASSNPDVFTIENTGDTALSVTNFARGGSNGGDFEYELRTALGTPISATDFTVDPSSYVTLNVTFSPTAAGARSANFTFDTNDADPADAAVSLAVTGSATANGGSAPAAPSDASASATSSSQITLSWIDNSADESGFKIYQSTSADGTYTLVNTVAADTETAAVTGLRGNTHYYYQVKAYNADGESSAATANATTPIPADPGPNNSAAAPYSIGTLYSPRIYRNYVGETDPRDYYKVRMAAAGKLRVSVSELSGATSIKVYRLNSNGSLSTVATRSASTRTWFNVSTSSGYYIVGMVRSGATNTNYRLALTPDYAGNTRALARNGGSATSTVKTFYDAIGNTDIHDYYKITLSSSRTLRLALSQLALDADLELLNSSGTVITASEKSGSSSESIARKLAAGTYYIHVTAWEPQSDTGYKLTISAS